MKTVEEFDVWYRGLLSIGLIIPSAEALEGCAMFDNCSTCKNRAYCLIRPFFYYPSADHDELKNAMLTKFNNQLMIKKIITDNFDQILSKMELEIRKNPKYSCEYCEE